MKILMLPVWFGGVSWWRFDMPTKALIATGHEVYTPTADELSHDIARKGNNPFQWLEEKMPQYDIVHAGYTSDPSMAIALFNLRDKYNVPVVVDIDDDLDNVPTYNKGWMGFHPGSRGQRVAKTQLAHADGITFSTAPLAEALAYLAKNNISTVLGNWIDPYDWDYPAPKERAQDESIRLMVTGGSGRYGDWEIFEEPLKWALNHYDGTDNKPLLKVFFMGGTPAWVLPYMENKVDPFANRVFYLHPTPNARLFNRIVRYVSPDIIISPTLKNTFNRSKSGIKFLEASLAGAAFLCTDYPTYDIAPKGSCLKVDNTPTQWKESLSALIEDPVLRAQLIDKARDHVLANCTVEKHILDRVGFYEQVIARRRTNLASPKIPNSPQEHIAVS